MAGKTTTGNQVGKATIKWHGVTLEKNAKKHMKKRVRKASYLLERRVKLALAKRQTRVHGPSAPGEVPHKDEGNLGKTIINRQDAQTGLTAIVGTPLKYGLWLEVGTTKMAARPYLRPTLDQSRLEINTFLTAPLPPLT